MARKPRVDIGDQIYHVINRANQRRRIFGQKSNWGTPVIGGHLTESEMGS